MKNNETPLLPNTVYHIYNHANGWDNLFSSERNYDYFLKRYAYFIAPIVKTYAYCLMPNHLHLMIKIKDAKDLQAANLQFQLDKEIPLEEMKFLSEDDFPKFISKVFSNFFSSYAQSYNKEQKRRGSLFMPNFKRKKVKDNDYFSNLIYYIHNNPVHHGFANEIEDWDYCSYNIYLSSENIGTDKLEILDWFGGIDAFKAFHQAKKECIEDFEELEF